MKRFIFFVSIIAILFSSCSPSSSEEIVGIATWNMGTFFDGRDDGTEFSEWKFSSSWSGEKYSSRIKSTVQYILTNFKDADIIIVQEIESVGVLSDLVQSGLKQGGYTYFGLAQNNSGALSVGFISRIRPQNISLVSYDNNRPFLLLTFLLGNEEINVLGVHLRSRLNEKNTCIRKEELELIKTISKDISSPLIVLGDFNSDPFLHTDEMAEERNGNQKILTLTGDGSKALSGLLYSPFLDYSSPLKGGTYFYDGEWEILDNILMNSAFFDSRGIEFKESRIIKGSGSTDYSGLPMIYDKETGKGYSDHFALLSIFQL